ncbi:MAG: hypothetical protein IKF79_08780 [Methanosphaera sp.]|nr:hypothetical protein [Methanosphaera sp.]
MNTEYEHETIKEKIQKAFSLKGDSAPDEQIRSRLLDGGQVTGTNMCVLVCRFKYELNSSNYWSNANITNNGKYSCICICKCNCRLSITT